MDGNYNKNRRDSAKHRTQISPFFGFLATIESTERYFIVFLMSSELTSWLWNMISDSKPFVKFKITAKNTLTIFPAVETNHFDSQISFLFQTLEAETSGFESGRFSNWWFQISDWSDAPGQSKASILKTFFSWPCSRWRWSNKSQRDYVETARGWSSRKIEMGTAYAIL